MKNYFRIYLAAIVCSVLLTNVSTQEPEPESEGSTETRVRERSCDGGSGTCAYECDEKFKTGEYLGCGLAEFCCGRSCLSFVNYGIYGICRPKSVCKDVFSRPFSMSGCREGEVCCLKYTLEKPLTP